MNRIVLLVLLALSVGCMGRAENHAIRQAIVQEVLRKEAVDLLMIRLQPGEARADFGFQGDTVFFLGPGEEEEFWQVRNPKLRCLFIKDIFYYSQTEAQVGMEILQGDLRLDRVLNPHKRDGSWRVGQPRPESAIPGSAGLSLSLGRGRDR